MKKRVKILIEMSIPVALELWCDVDDDEDETVEIKEVQVAHVQSVTPRTVTESCDDEMFEHIDEMARAKAKAVATD